MADDPNAAGGGSTAHRASLNHLLRVGALLSALFAGAALGYGGIVLDEAVEFAQILSGSVEYPSGHPFDIYYRSAPTIASYLAVALWQVNDDPLVLSAARNFAQLFLTGFTAFALTAVLTRRALWALAASAATFTATSYHEYIGSYVLFVFPNYYSNGQIGAHLTLLSVALILGRYLKWGGFLLGALPAIHLAMVAIAWPWALAHFLSKPSHRAAGAGRKALLGWSLGVTVSAAFFASHYLPSPIAEPAAPYDVADDGGAAYRGFTALDWHRRPLDPLSRAYLLSPIALLVVGLSLWRQTRRLPTPAVASHADLHANVVSLLVLGLVTWGFVYGVWLFERLAGWLPTAVTISMPNRHTNISVMLLLPLTLTALWAALAVADPATRRLGRLLLAGLIAIAGTAFFEQPDRVQHYLLPSLWALLLAVEIRLGSGQGRHLGLTAVETTVLLAAVWVTSGLALTAFVLLTLTGTLSVLTLGRARFSPALVHPRLRSGLDAALAGGCALLAAACGHVGTSRPIYDVGARLSPFDVHLQDWLEHNAQPGEPLLAFHHPYSYLPAKTGHPVVADATIYYTISYLPRLGPVVAQLARDVYGVDLTRPEPFGTLSDAITSTGGWTERTPAQWGELGRRYGFRLILSPTELPLTVPAVLTGPRWTLHAVSDPAPWAR